MTYKEFTNFVETEGKSIYSFCYNLTQNKDDADDLYQDTFLQAMEYCSKIDCSNNPKSYLLGIAIRIWKNTCRKHERRHKIAPQYSNYEEIEPILSSQEEVSLEEQLIMKELCHLVSVETAALSEKYKLPVYLYYTAELSTELIAKILHIPNGTVKSRLYKARKLIKKRLEEQGYENR